VLELVHAQQQQHQLQLLELLEHYFIHHLLSYNALVITIHQQLP
jgi:hypothetical protein